jgi:glycerol-3-phosphate dehydrogenase
MIPHTDDGRVLFAIPWYENVLVGTTDTPLSAHSLEPRALKSEVDFVLNTAANYFSKVPSRRDVLSVFAGLRPLAATGDNSDKTKEISRSHKVLISKSGLISVIGGKWTTYRKMAEDTLSTIIRNKMLPDKVCKTEHLKIHGYEPSPQHNGQFSIYGSDKKGIQKIIETDAGAGTSLSNTVQLTKAQVIWAVRNEMAQTVEDLLARRTRILFINAREAQRLAPEVADIMMKELHKDEEWKQNQVAHFDQLANGYVLDGHPIKDASPHVNEN